MHLAQVVLLYHRVLQRTRKNWKLPSVWKTVSYRVRRGRITISTGGCATGSTRCEVAKQPAELDGATSNPDCIRWSRRVNSVAIW